jgi:C-terminal processing protease CtpA/Prc
MYDNAAQSGVTYKYINRVNNVEVNSPAERAGMCIGDIIIAVDHVNIDDGQRLYLPDDVAELIHGQEGSRVVVVIEREGRKIEYTIIRAPIIPALDTTRSSMLPTSPLPSIRDTTESFKRLVSPELDRALDIIDDKVGIDLRRMF